MEVGDMAGKKESGKNVSAKKQVTEKVLFEFRAPEAQEVCLAGDFNNWDVRANPMKRNKIGLWKVTLPLAPGRYEYRYISDGCWESDPSCSCCAPNQFGSMNSVIIVE